MEVALRSAIVSRWNDAGLDSSIANLYAAGEGSSGGRNTTGSPAGTSLPRAEYTLTTPRATAKSRNSRVYQSVAVIKAWGTSALTVAGWVDSISGAFLNADEAGSNPMTGVLEVEDAGRFSRKVDDELHIAQVTLAIMVRDDNTVPA